MQYFDDELLTDYMDTFFGYGNYEGRYWFIGMEEGGGNSFNDVNHRLSTWKEMGRNELHDVIIHDRSSSPSRWFGEKARLQPTWSKLIRVQLAIENQTATKEMVREVQKNNWARSQEKQCVIELLPLPSPSTSHWLYSQHSKLKDLASRTQYRESYRQPRIESIKKRIHHYQPPVVVFYSFSYLGDWELIVGNDFMYDETRKLYWQQSAETCFFVVKHPVTKGITNEYFDTVGRFIREKVSSQEFTVDKADTTIAPSGYPENKR